MLSYVSRAAIRLGTKPDFRGEQLQRVVIGISRPSTAHTREVPHVSHAVTTSH